MSNATAFQTIFEGNPVAHYTWKPGEYNSIDRGIELTDIERHIKGVEPGVLSIPVLPTGLCHFACGDCDRHDTADEAIDHAAIALKIEENHFPLIITRSKSVKSAHVWLFFKDVDGFDCATARKLIAHYMKVLGIEGDIEIFPKQETLKEGQKGSGINLCYFGNSRVGFGRDGEELSLEQFVSLVREKQSFGRKLVEKHLGVGPSGPSAPKDTSDRALTIGMARDIHQKNLSDLRASNKSGQRNITLNTCAFWAGRAFASGALEGTEQDIKTAIRTAASGPGGLDDRERENTLERSWKDGLKQRLKILHVATSASIKRPDMPESVLDGKLGKWCKERLPDFPIAYSWPSMLVSASVLVKPHVKNRVNLYECLVGAIHSGKSQAQDRANFLFNLKDAELLEELKSGSAEGLLEKIGDRKGEPILWWPDELSHLLEKAQIEHSSFPFVLNSVFYNDSNKLTVAHRKHVTFNARLSLAGGLVEDNFGDSFGAATVAGLHDRFLFGVCPSDFHYKYRPMEGGPLFNVKNEYGDKLIGPVDAKGNLLNIATPAIHSDVWEARDAIRESENIEARVLEIAIRCALICAAWDGREVLRASELEPCFELARYQTRVRALLSPNAGRNFEGIVAIKILSFLKANSDGEKWVPWRTVYRATRIMEFGPSLCDRAVSGMVFAGDIESVEVSSKGGGRGKRLIRLALDEAA